MDKSKSRVVILKITPQGEERVYEAEYTPDEEDSAIQDCANALFANALRAALGGTKKEKK